MNFSSGLTNPSAQGVQSVVHCGDCLEILQEYPDACVDLIITSPPYADQRSRSYGGISPDDYVAWMLPRTAELLRVLKPTGSFILNIKEKVVQGERHTYVLELIIALRKQGWLWTEEYIWHKKNCFPGKWPNRFRDAWERCLHFTKSRQFTMNQEAVMVPMGEWAKTRLKSLGKNDVVRFESQVGNGFGKNIAHWKDRSQAYPSNVLHMATECANKGHSATFPTALPLWFISLFTHPGDMVLDPFVGSGTTLEAAWQAGRQAIGIDVKEEYVQISVERLEKCAPSLGAFIEPPEKNPVTRTRKAICAHTDCTSIPRQTPQWVKHAPTQRFA